MSRNNLHAEQRVDKRGSIVTRWVKGFSQPKAPPVRPPSGMAMSDVPTIAGNANKVNNTSTMDPNIHGQNKAMISKAADKKDLDLLHAYQKNLKNYSAAEINYTVRALREMGHQRTAMVLKDKHLTVGSGVIKAVMSQPERVPPKEILRVMTIAMDSMEDSGFIIDAIKDGQYPFRQTVPA